MTQAIEQKEEGLLEKRAIPEREKEDRRLREM